MKAVTRQLYVAIYGDPTQHCADCKTPAPNMLINWALKTDEDGDRYLLCPKCSGNDQL
jgi:DNA-directed RNA polymerase subunit RPC12/RpoP